MGASLRDVPRVETCGRFGARGDRGLWLDSAPPEPFLTLRFADDLGAERLRCPDASTAAG